MIPIGITSNVTYFEIEAIAYLVTYERLDKSYSGGRLSEAII